MQKKNLDMMYAINFLARGLKKGMKSIGYAGNKDKRGITTQLISIYNTGIEEIIQLTKKPFWERNMKVDNFFYKETPLKLGSLKGNQFCVALRFIKGDLEKAKNRIESAKKFGFLNYYGMQRFGCNGIPTHKIGVFVLKRKWEKVILNILNVPTIQEILKIKEENLTIEDIHNNLDLLYKQIHKGKNNCEFSIIKSLKKNKNDFSGAFKSLPRQLQVLYPHAFQSYIWNKIVSDRIKKFGMKILIGDIVLRKNRILKDADLEEEIIEEENPENFEKENEDKEIENLNHLKHKEFYDKRNIFILFFRFRGKL